MNKFTRFFSLFFKILFVDVLWLLFSIPVVTAGASTVAAFYVMLKLVEPESENIHIFKTFVKGFKDNIKQGTLMLLISLPTIGGTVYLWRYIVQESADTWLKVVAIIVSVIVVLLNLYTYPLIARYENTFKNTIKNAMTIAIQYLYSTVIICILLAVEVIVWGLNIWIMLGGLLIMPGLMCFTESYFVKKTFLAVEKL